MKKILWALLILILLILSGLGYIFFKPGVVINPRGLKFALDKTKILKSYSWKEGEIVWGYKTWNNRLLSGSFKDLCFEYESEAIKLKTCLDEVSWNVEIIGLSVKTLAPFVVHSSATDVALGKSKEEEKKPAPLDIWGYWTKLWSDLVPDMDVSFKRIVITMSDNKVYDLDFKLVKSGKELNADALNYHLWASPEKLEITAPPKIALPKKFEGFDTFYFKNFKLTALMKKSEIKLNLAGAFESADIKITSQVDLPIKDEFTSVVFLKKVILATKGDVSIPGFKQNLVHYAPDPFKELPAPFNIMDGSITAKITTADIKNQNRVMILAATNIDLKSSKQVLDLDISTDVPFNLKTFKPESVTAGLNFNQVQIQLPRLSKKSPPPQFIPDGRFKNRPFKPEVKSTDKPLDVSLHLAALHEQAMSFKTNLLDEVLKLNFNLNIDQGKLKDGYVSVLPLATKIFKRPVELKHLKVTFRYPVDPVIEAVVQFPLPEYKITVNLEGPVSKPRYAFSSEPPLPQNDIYAVLLFGRPMADLDPDDKTAAQQTNQLLSQGILSLSVLYFLAGSPVEYVGYDAGSKNAVAQFGLGNKTSLRVGGGQEGINSSAIRRSLGKGWYIDTSVQNSTNATNTDSKNYGVLLERIIAY